MVLGLFLGYHLHFKHPTSVLNGDQFHRQNPGLQDLEREEETKIHVSLPKCWVWYGSAWFFPTLESHVFEERGLQY